MIELSKIDRELAFKIKTQISLIWNAERVMNLYLEKKEKFLEYIEERKMVIREILHMDHGEIFENGKKIFEI